MVLTHIACAAKTLSVLKGFLRTFTQRRGMQFHASCLTDNLEELTNAFSVLQNEQEHIKTDVGEIKDDVKQLVSKPAKRWDGLIDKAIAVVVGAAIGFLLNGGGF